MNHKNFGPHLVRCLKIPRSRTSGYLVDILVVDLTVELSYYVMPVNVLCELKRRSVHLLHIYLLSQYYVLSSSLSDTMENLVLPLQAAKAPLKASQSLFTPLISIGAINSF